jgi:glutathione S-transferase
MRLYYASGSPFAWRAQLALEEKGIAYDKALLSFQAGDLQKPEYLAISPHGKVPALTDGDVSLYESHAIVEYLEERYPKPALLPSEPAARARTRIEELEATLYFGEAFIRVGRQMFFTPPEKRDQKELAEAKTAVLDQLAKLEKRAAARGGDFIMGTSFSRADVAWIPFVEICGRAGIDVDAAKMPWLHAWRDRMRARPGYDRSYPPHWRNK